MFRTHVKLVILLALLALGPPPLRARACAAPAAPAAPEAYGVAVWADDDWLQMVDTAIVGDDWEEAYEMADEISVHIGGAEVYDLMTGCPARASDIRDGMAVRVGLAGPLSYAGEAEAAEVWLNYGEMGAAAFLAVVSENIQYDDGYCTFTTGDGKYRVTLTEDTYITGADYHYYRPEDIEPGLAMFVWVDMVTASSPAEAYPDKAVLLD